MRQPWHEYFLDIAALVASRSEDASTKVGCVIVGPDHELRATGYNGMPRGVAAKPERLERPEKYLWTSHAESNAVCNAARSGVALKGCTAFVTHMCCADCARMLIQAGITNVWVGPGTTSMPAEQFEVARRLFFEGGVRVWDKK